MSYIILKKFAINEKHVTKEKRKECKIFLQDMSLCESSSIIKKLLVGGLFVQQLTKPRSTLPNTYYIEVGNIAHLEQNHFEFAINDFRKSKSASGFIQAFLCTVVWRYDGKFVLLQKLTNDRRQGITVLYCVWLKG